MTDFNNSETSEVDVLNGWFLMVRRTALEQVGMLDEQFFMYGEDIDWSYRFHKAGSKCVYFSGARAFHYGGASSAIAPSRFYFEMKRANLQLYRKHYGRFSASVYLTITFIHEIVRALGNSVLAIFSKSGSSRASQKLRRSLMCMWWFVSFRRPKLG